MSTLVTSLVNRSQEGLTELFVALDVDSVDQALGIAKQAALGNPIASALGFKVGPRLLYKAGSSLVAELAQYGTVFVDCKFLDIPSTMEASVRTSFEAGASYCTIHALAGPKALEQLAKLEAQLSLQRPFRILTVTVLTSFSPETLPKPLRGSGQSIAQLTRDLVLEAAHSGLSSFVCSPQEIQTLRGLEQELKTELFLVTPGIRPAGSAKGDQVRIETPEAAGRLGASALVVGRPILESSDRAQAVQGILTDFRNGRRHLSKSGVFT